jgi:hypothetical protein
MSGVPARTTHDYIRYGTTSLSPRWMSLRARSSRRVPLDQAVAALRAVESGHAGGKTVLAV